MLQIEQLSIDAHDPRSLAAWWAEALGWQVTDNDEDPDDPSEEYEVAATDRRQPILLFLPVPESKTVKNRLHLDFRPDDQAAEVARLEALGASRVDVGQGDVSWVVLADPEGNEFCVLSSPQP
ncbi:VOC family protein [Herbiconiux sp. CPCC 205763]|uniref:VOC family protein n=1 Tax=Herbiconiux aconitum TaxID=2970913 RepID=A0ABT2GN65_9MICO|nr:VOC family protein [Herbiconiux aconitum]MCS5717670.1 VOC family protein [Herbiconiux aconitum]